MQNIDSKSKAFWQYINLRLKTHPNISEILSPSGSTVCSNSEKASIFNQYFCSVFATKDFSVIPMVCSSASPPVVDSIDITPDIVFGKVMNLQSGKFAGLDGWPIHLIKSVGELIAFPLSIIFNKSLLTVFYQRTGRQLM